MGALLVALITSYTARKRQSTALEAEANRLKAQLAAEAGRLNQQLNHERRLSDVADLRTVLEETLNAIDDYVTKARQLHDAHEVAVAAGEITENMRAEATRHAWDLVEISNRVNRTINRLQTRLTDDDPILAAHQRLHDALGGIYDALREDRETYSAAESRQVSAYRDCREAHPAAGDS